jgi:hypothetical protein
MSSYSINRKRKSGIIRGFKSLPIIAFVEDFDSRLPAKLLSKAVAEPAAIGWGVLTNQIVPVDSYLKFRFCS